MKVDMSGEIVVITAGGGVICGAMAKEYAKNGAKVAVLDLKEEAAKAVADEIVKDGGVAKAYGVNCLETESLEKAHQAILKDFGKCTILVNGAGGNNPKGTTTNEYFNKLDLDDPTKVSFFDLDPSGVDFVFKINFLGTFLTTQVFAKDMLDNGGCVINISSMNAYRPLTKIPAYSGAKAAVSNFTQWLAVHFAGANIRVNAIAPGFFVTNQNRALLYNSDGTPTPRTGKIIAGTPMRKFGEISDLMGATMFLSDKSASGFITGVVLPIDGGFSAYSGV